MLNLLAAAVQRRNAAATEYTKADRYVLALIYLIRQGFPGISLEELEELTRISRTRIVRACRKLRDT